MNVNYLRVSVTDRCNLRCVYCNPLGSERTGSHEGLSVEEISRIVRLSAECGIRTVRLTGGEPLVREDIVGLIKGLARISGIKELALTTNGVLLAQRAASLRDAGLDRVNVSLDAVEPGCFQRMTGSDGLAQVLAGIDKAIAVGLTPVRINCVVLREINLSQVTGLAEFSAGQPVSVRFIEYCPTSRHAPTARRYVPNSEVRRIIESRFGPLSDVLQPDSGGPAVYSRIQGASGTLGFISGRSSNFCGRCSRLRLTSDGRIRPCLHGTRSYDVKGLMRTGADDPAIVAMILEAVRDKGHTTKWTAPADDFVMQHVGG